MFFSISDCLFLLYRRYLSLAGVVRNGVSLKFFGRLSFQKSRKENLFSNIQLALPSIALGEAFFEHIPEGFVADKAPIAPMVVARWCFGCEALDYDVGA